MLPKHPVLLTAAMLMMVGLANHMARSQSALAPAHHSHAGMASAQTTLPTLPGQDAFGAVQEIVRILEADPTTDWTRVNLEALREHLIDMNEVTLKASAVARPIDNGVSIMVTGDGRTLDAIRRMIPAHARELSQLPNWIASTAPLANGTRLTVTTTDPGGVARIRGLGFIGLMVSGSHHQPHHLAMARGTHIH
jgi:hypothetical protein